MTYFYAKEDVDNIDPKKKACFYQSLITWCDYYRSVMRETVLNIKEVSNYRNCPIFKQ